MANCPTPEGTLVRVNLGPSEINLLGLEILLPNGLCLIIRGDNLTTSQKAKIMRFIRKNSKKLKVTGSIVSDGKRKSQIMIKSVKPKKKK